MYNRDQARAIAIVTLNAVRASRARLSHLVSEDFDFILQTIDIYVAIMLLVHEQAAAQSKHGLKPSW